MAISDQGEPYYDENQDGGGGSYTPPQQGSGDWAAIADLTGGITPYKAINLVGVNTSAIRTYGGTFTVLAVSAKQITLSNPGNSNPTWAALTGATSYGSATLSVSGERWVGPFVADLDDMEHLITNFIGPAGLYRINKKSKQLADSVGVVIELTPIDENDAPIGPAELFPATLQGSRNDKDQVGLTIDARPTFTGRCNVRARRTTPTDLDYEGTIVDDVKWRDAWAASSIGDIDFGDVTTVLAKTYATSGATSVKERKLNLRARRQLPQRIEGSQFSAELFGTDDMADIVAAVSLDPFIGGRTPAEIDFDSLYDTSEAIAAYFGTDRAREFSFTFDNDDTSFEETIASIASANFAHAYRQGAVIKLSFERATEDSSLLFNHRNILPGSQRRTQRFGVLDDQDGVELEYFVPKDGAQLTVTLPPHQTATSPRRIELPGIGNPMLAYWQAWRAWYRMQFQSIAVELEATQEAALVLPQERVLIVDITRPDFLSGDVENQDGAVLTLSEEIELDADAEYQIFLQLPDGTVQSLPVEPWLDGDGEASDPYKVQLGSIPRLPLITEPERAVPTTYSIARANDVPARAFLISEREPNSDFTESVKAANYSFLYYQNDQLLFWLGVLVGGGLVDESAWRHGLALVGDGTLAQDDDRAKPVYVGGGPGSQLTIFGLPAIASYTKIAWVGDGVTGNLLGTGDERFAVEGGQIVIAHGGNSIGVPLAPGWQHVATTFDADSSIARIFVNGRLAIMGPLAARSLGDLVAFADLTGRADDLRLYPRPLEATEILSLYQGSRTPASGSFILTTDGGRAITFDDGNSIVLG